MFFCKLTHLFDRICCARRNRNSQCDCLCPQSCRLYQTVMDTISSDRRHDLSSRCWVWSLVWCYRHRHHSNYSLLKTSRPNWHLEPMLFEKFNVCKSLCIVRYLKTYMSKTKRLRGCEKQLFVSYTKPHKAVVKSTISRWIRDLLHRAGIDVSVYKAHSTRAAASSKAAQYLPIEKILKAGGWSSSSSYIKHYKLPCLTSSSSGLVLDKHV